MTLAQVAALPPGFVIATLGLLGLLVGSFLNVVILRLPVMLERRWRAQCDELAPDGAPHPAPERFDLMAPRSRCPQCGHRLTALENIPIASYLWLRGKCRACRKPISPRYPLVELATGLLSAAVAWRFGVTPTLAGALVLTWALIALSVIDSDHQLLPDDITLPLVWGGLAINLYGVYASLPAAVIGAIAGYVSLWLVYQLFKLITGREGMGYGDFKLFAAFGAWLGWQSLPLIILLSSFLGAVIGVSMILLLGRDRTLPIPFGPFLCGAGWVALMWGDSITRAYLQFMRFPV